MDHEVLVSRTFQRQFDGLPEDDRARTRQGLQALSEDPRTPRSGADIRKLSATTPPKHRLRVGSYRVIYRIQRERVKVLELFQRGRGYRD